MADSFQCQECFGTGRNKKGGPCQTCRATGRVGGIAAGFSALGALLRLAFGIAIIVVIIIAVASGGGSSHASAKTPADKPQWQKDGLVGPEVEQCYGALSFGTKQLCNTEWEIAFADYIDPNGQPDAHMLLSDMPNLRRRCRRHDSPSHCGYLLGQSLSIAASSY